MVIDPPGYARIACGLPDGLLLVTSTWRHRDPKWVGAWVSQPPSDRVWPIPKVSAKELLRWEVFEIPEAFEIAMLELASRSGT